MSSSNTLATIELSGKGAINLSQLTPMMKQYQAIKKEYQDAILFYRLGDFYETFFEDAKLVAKELEIVLTSREGGKGQKIPMAGIPFHASDSYIAKLVSNGYKIAICEQVEDPKTAKGLVKREVVRVITPGTVIDASLLEEKRNNYLASIILNQEQIGLAIVDVSTGEFLVTELTFDLHFDRLIEELSRLLPRECILNSALYNNSFLIERLQNELHAVIYHVKDEVSQYRNARNILLEHFNVISLEGFGCEGEVAAIRAAGALLAYLAETQRINLTHITRLCRYNSADFMLFDTATRRNLELTRTIRHNEKKGTLMWVLDRTLTAMGGRLLRKWIEQPLIDVELINNRLDAVEELVNNVFLQADLREMLNKIYDLERIVAKATYGTINAKDIVALKESLINIQRIKEILKQSSSAMLSNCCDEITPLSELVNSIEAAIVDDPPFSVKEGGIIKQGYNAEVDKLRIAKSEGKQWIADLEAREKERTGIKSLKVGFNKVFGYYIEVTNPNLSLVPDDYMRKQTLANAERFITPQLKEYEDLILDAEYKLVDLEYSLFCELRELIKQKTLLIQKNAAIIACIDVLSSLAEVALHENYCKPQVNQSDRIKIINGRHPVIEKMLGAENFVPNDVNLDCSENRMLIITGPNMAGKSTFMRQVALIVLMAQIGSFVPAQAAEIGVVDRIFTRVGAADNLVSGESTFMVEMNEVANILNHATRRSLVILDEVGRGTSTFDGISIAWAVAEYLNDQQRIGAKTLFATHYHELTELADKLEGVKNYSVAVKEKGEQIIFLRKIVSGGTDCSYGIQVARLAGLPNLVLKRAKEILDALENKKNHQVKPRSRTVKQLSLFPLEENLNTNMKKVIDEIQNLDIMAMTPLEAMNKLYMWQQMLKKGETADRRVGDA